MKVTIVGDVVTITLSKDNARDIQSMADQNITRALQRRCENDLILQIRVESNEDHYANRNYQGRPIPQGRGFRDANWRQN
jgi:hypothetical protein